MFVIRRQRSEYGTTGSARLQPLFMPAPPLPPTLTTPVDTEIAHIWGGLLESLEQTSYGADEFPMRRRVLSDAGPSSLTAEQRAAMVKQEADDYEFARRLDSSGSECKICLDDHPEDEFVVVEGCGHRMCGEGLSAYVGTKLRDNVFPVPCPICISESDKDHATFISRELAEGINLPKEDLELWTNYELSLVSLSVQCPSCRKVVSVDLAEYRSSKIIKCPLPDCCTTWCTRCTRTTRWGTKHSCAIAAAKARVARLATRSPKADDGSTQFEKLLKDQRWQRCPGCRAPVEKINGCNHMACRTRGCNIHFCYRCGGVKTRQLNIKSLATSPLVSIAYKRCKC